MLTWHCGDRHQYKNPAPFCIEYLDLCIYISIVTVTLSICDMAALNLFSGWRGPCSRLSPAVTQRKRPSVQTLTLLVQGPDLDFTQ